MTWFYIWLGLWLAVLVWAYLTKGTGTNMRPRSRRRDRRDVYMAVWSTLDDGD